VKQVTAEKWFWNFPKLKGVLNYVSHKAGVRLKMVSGIFQN
jgi:hypothetical protein